MDSILSIFVGIWFVVASTFLFYAIMNLVAPSIVNLTSNLWSTLHGIFTR